MLQLNRRALAVVFALASVPAWAQSDDPPSRVARLSYQSGSVAFRPGTVEEWSAATVNYPLTTGDHLWTDAGSQTEIHAGSAAIRMAPQTAMSFLNLDDRTIQLSVTQGSVQIHLRSLEPDETFEVATPNVAVTLLRPGDYRIDADGENNITTVTVRGGDSAVTGGGIAFPVHARETARIRGTDTVTEEVGPAIGMDEFERWCESRDRREEQSISAQYVPREMTGYQDLDDYGTWREEPEHGWVWAPRTVAVDWAPYRHGRWAWIEPWGWTWIDDAPWGFAPFHYGRWANTSGLWIWIPGRRTPGIRPVYAPALVAFVGGPRFGISMAAWFPLGPREVYRPGYRHSDRYLRNVNVTHVTNVTVINNVNVANVRYANHRAGAVTAVSNDTFVSARHVGRDAARLDGREIQQAQVVGMTAHVPPRRESVLSGPVRNAPPRRAERTVVVRTAPPPAPVSFGARQRALEVNQGRPLDPRQVETLRRDAPPRPSMVRTVGPVRQTNPARDQQPQTQFGTRDSAPRNDRPQRVQPAPAEPPRGFGRPQQEEQPRQVEQRRPDPPRQADPPRGFGRPQQQEPPRQIEQRRPDPPRQVERPRQVEQPRAEPRRPDTPRQVEQPRRAEPRVERPAPPPAEGGRGAQRERRDAEQQSKPPRPQDRKEK